MDKIIKVKPLYASAAKTIKQATRNCRLIQQRRNEGYLVAISDDNKKTELHISDERLKEFSYLDLYYVCHGYIFEAFPIQKQ